MVLHVKNAYHRMFLAVYEELLRSRSERSAVGAFGCRVCRVEAEDIRACMRIPVASLLRYFLI